MMTHEQFRTGHALSFSRQPYLVSLFDQVCDTAQPLTIVVGAGVAMNAGLRSWSGLVMSIGDQLKDRRIQDVIRNSSGDLARRAELLVQLVSKAYPNRNEAEIIRRALYPRDFSAHTGGQLAKSIARLIAVRGIDNVTLVTTNFDTMLEGALSLHFPKEDIKPFSLHQIEPWEKWRRQGKVGVLHVHGVVPAAGQGRSQRPIVLTESQFLRHGADVREVIYENLRGACGMFVGLSVSDPNLIGPLYEMHLNREDSPRFNILVPDGIPAVEESVATGYAFESAEFMAHAFALKTIFTKSYSQLDQVISELALALRVPAKYRYRPKRPVSRSSLVYGDRVVRVLDACYKRIGCSRSEQIPVGVTAEALNTRLHRALRQPKGPLAVLRRISKSLDGGHPFGGADGENFALSLWLRCRGAKAGAYAIQLVGTSAFTHREEWSIRPSEEICRRSKIMAVQSVFRGALLVGNVVSAAEPIDSSPIWRGIVASPIVLERECAEEEINGVAADVLTIGAITLNSNRMIEGLGDDRGRVGEHCSIVSKLDTGYKNDLVTSLQWVASEILAS
jgi:hypothetical protein